MAKNRLGAGLKAPCKLLFGAVVYLKEHGTHLEHMGGCQNYGPCLDPYFNTAPSI